MYIEVLTQRYPKEMLFQVSKTDLFSEILLLYFLSVLCLTLISKQETLGIRWKGGKRLWWKTETAEYETHTWMGCVDCHQNHSGRQHPARESGFRLLWILGCAIICHLVIIILKRNFSPILFCTSCRELTHWKRLWCWEGLGAWGEGDDRGWDGWMASLTRWTWVWVNSGSWWWIGRPGVLRFVGS